MCTHMCMCVCLIVEVRSQHRVSSFIALTVFFETGSLTMRKLTDLLNRLASEIPGSAGLYFLSRGLQTAVSCLAFPYMVGTEIQYPCLCDRHVTH